MSKLARVALAVCAFIVVNLGLAAIPLQAKFQNAICEGPDGFPVECCVPCSGGDCSCDSVIIVRHDAPEDA